MTNSVTKRKNLSSIWYTDGNGKENMFELPSDQDDSNIQAQQNLEQVDFDWI